MFIMSYHFPPLALALYVCTLSQTMSMVLEAPSRKPADITLDPNDPDSDDWIDGIIEFDTDRALGRIKVNSTLDVHSNDSWCARSHYIVPSQEDIVAKRKNCSDTHILWHDEGFLCANPFGQHLRNKQNETFFYLEIPKTGSSTVRQMVMDHIVDPQPVVPMSELDVTYKAFAFVRHPVMRFVSAYGTILNHVMDQYKRKRPTLSQPLEFLWHMDEPNRFNKFVKLFVKHGDEILKWYNSGTVPCLMQHVLSQTWFLNFWPGPIELYDVDHFDEAVQKLDGYMKLNLTVPPSVNVREGKDLVDREMLMRQHDSIQMLNAYFEQDIRRFGYKPLVV